MTAGLTVLLALTFVTMFNLGLTYYTQFGTYALFPRVAEATDATGFRQYHEAYQRRLPVLVFGPFGLTIALSLTFLFIYPDEAALVGRILVLLLNLTVAVVSAVFAGPTHRRLLEAGEVSDGDAKALLRWNGIRLAVVLANSVTVSYLLVRSIS